ncbi:hypothetical protein LQ354_07905, partial [Neisseria cinerea]|nr:hypothetical protein [Neisseria cinerea]
MKNGSNCFRTIAQIWYYTLNIAAVNRKAEGASGIFCYACFNRERKYYSGLNLNQDKATKPQTV